MASDRFEIEPEEEYRKERGCCLGGCFKGCFLILLVMAVIGGVLVYFFANNLRDLAASGVKIIAEQSLDEMRLPEQEKQEVLNELDRPIEALRQGKLGGDQFGELVEALMVSPLLPSIAVSMVENQYLDQSTLTPEEKQSGRTALQRFAWGVVQGKFGEPEIEKVISHVADKQGEQWRFRETATDDQLRDMIIAAQEQADAANIPAEVPAIDPSDEVRKIIDQVLGPDINLEGQANE